MNIKFKSIILSSIIMFSLVPPITSNISKGENNNWGCRMATTQIKDNKELVPKLIKLTQISPNIIEVEYDAPVDINNALCLRNYWIQSLDKETPTGIATLGKNDKMDENNSLRRKDVKIAPKDDKNKVFQLQFNSEITPGEKYMLTASYIKGEGKTPYSGSNGEIKFVGK